MKRVIARSRRLIDSRERSEGSVLLLPTFPIAMVLGWEHASPIMQRLPSLPILLLLPIGISLFMAAAARADVSYSTIVDSSIIVTGVRSDSDSSDSVVISASKTTTGTDTVAALYDGSLADVTATNAV